MSYIEDAGSIVSQIRLDISEMDKDAMRAQKRMDSLASGFKQQGQTAGKGFAGGMKQAFTDVDQSASKLGRSIGKSLAPQMIALQAGIKVISGIARAFKDAFMANEKLARGVTALKSSFSEGFASALKPVSDFFGNIIDKATESTRKAQEAKEALKNIKQEVENINNSFSSGMYTIGKSLDSGLIDKFSAANDRVEVFNSKIKSLNTRSADIEVLLDAGKRDNALTAEKNNLDNKAAQIQREKARYQYVVIESLNIEADLQKEITAAEDLRLDTTERIKKAREGNKNGLEGELKIQSSYVDSLNSQLATLDEIIANGKESLKYKTGHTPDELKALADLQSRINAAEATRTLLINENLNKEKVRLENIEKQVNAAKDLKWLDDTRYKQYVEMTKQTIEQLRAEAAIEKDEKKKNILLNDAINLENTLIEKQREIEKQSLVNSESFKRQSEEVKQKLLADFDQITEGMIKSSEKTASNAGGNNNWLALALGINDDTLGDIMNVGEATISAFNDISESILEISRQHAEEQIAIIEKALNANLNNIEKAKKAALIANGFMVENNAESLEAQLEAAERTGDEILIYQTQRRLEEQRINDEFDAQAKEAQEEAARQKAEIEYNMARQEHAMKLINAITSGAMAVLQALQSASPPVNFILAGLTGIAAGVQIGLIASNPPQRPVFESGGIVPGGSFSGDKIIAGVNSGELILNRSQQDNIAEQLESTFEATIVVMLDAKEIGKTTFELANKGHYTLNTRVLRG